MSSSRKASSLAPEFPLLGMLVQSPSHGYALHAQLKQELGEIWNISLSQTYNILKRLEAKGHITGVEQEGEDGPDRYELQATASGRQHFQGWLLTPSSSSSQALRVEFLTRLYFARRGEPALQYQLIEEQAAKTTKGIVHLKKRHSNLAETSQVNQWALEVRIHQILAFSEWLDQTKAALAQPTE